MTRYLSVCSGIEAATVAWHPLGWKPVAFSEIEPFPCAVLAHHYPDVPNWGDMTKFKDWPDANIDVLVGGTPCQSFSVAGLRKGLADPRGNLALTYLAIADRYRPAWLVWENVPGVLSSGGGRDFGSIVGGMVELGYSPAWRVLDAQYVRTHGFHRAVPQRRRRVILVGHLGDWRRSAAVLFEPESLSGNPPPRREAGKGIADRASRSVALRGRDGGGTAELGDDVADALRASQGGGDKPHALIASTGDIAHCLNAGAMGRIDYESETMIAHALRADGFDASEDGTGRGTPIVPTIARTLTRGAESAGKGGYAGRRQEDDDNLIAFAHQQGGSSDLHYGKDVAIALQRSQEQAIAFAQNQRDELRQMDVAGALAAEPGMKQQTYLSTGWAVRRLTPTECERLQGFPDGYTAIEYRGKPAADGPRYKALGNSMAVNVMRWIGQRIELVSELSDELLRSAA